MKKNKGNTLVEVIVSIVVVSIIVGMMITVFVRSKNIEAKLEKEDVYITEVSNIFNLFSSNPDSFEDNLDEVYDFIKEDEKIKINIKYNSYIELNTLKEDNKYTLVLSVYNSSGVINKYDSLKRTIIHGGN